MALGPARRSKRQAGQTREVPTAERNRQHIPNPVSTAEDGGPTATGWLLRGKDDRLTAYAPALGGVLRWTETMPGGPDWTGPELVARAEGLQPFLAVAQGADGYVHFFGVRQTPVGGGDEVRTDIVHAIQYQTGRPVKEWQPLGTPYPNDWKLAVQIGRPAAVVDGGGNVHVFVRNVGGGVCARSQTSTGAWKPWADLKGSGAHGRLAAGAADGGRAEVLAPARESVMRWVQDGDQPLFTRDGDIPSHVQDGSVSAVATGEDRLTFFWRDEKSGEVQAWRQDSVPEPLGGASGSGPVSPLRAAVDGHDCTLMAHRDTDGRPALAAYPTETESAGAVWTGTGEACVGAPALAVDARGRVVLAAFAADGSLRLTRQKTNEPGLAMEAWIRI